MTDPYRPENPCPTCFDKSTKLTRAVAWLRVHVHAWHVGLGALFVITWAATFGTPSCAKPIGWSCVGGSVLLCFLACIVEESSSPRTDGARIMAWTLVNAAALAVALAVFA